VYRRPMTEPEYLREVQQLDLDEIDRSAKASRSTAPMEREALAERSANAALLALLGSPTIGSKKWVYRQYDHMVRTNTINFPGLGAGVVRIKGTDRALAMSVDGNGRYCYLDPYQGAMLAVAEAARNVACAGAKPLGATNCLNFGNPERPEIMWQLVEAIEGIAEACRALDVPITGGNVSLYNETNGEGIHPTPIIGVVGVLDDASRVLARPFREAGDEIVLLGENFGELGGSEYLKTVHGVVKGAPPRLDLARERALIGLLTVAAGAGVLRSAHDCSDGGVAVTLAESAFETGGIGLDVDLPAVEGAGADAVLFGESASRVVVSVRPGERATLMQMAAEAGVPAQVIGVTGGTQLRMRVAGGSAIDCTVAEAEHVWSGTIGRHFLRATA
jgi:phosphoribosylformylglycinamidine synthase subunit PurL